jgi:multidrug efflux pump subunit AcrA (membrane-fusion protein)
MTAARFVAKTVKREERLMARFNVLAVAASAACLGVCGPALAAPAVHNAPARVEATPDAKIKKVTLTPKAAERLGIQIDEVRVDPSGRRIVPYAAVLYDLTGKTWVYVSADPLTFARAAVEIDTIKGENVYLKDGPPPGTKVLAAGVAQVFGTEVGVGH